MSADAVTDDLAKTTLEDGTGDAAASGDAIYTSELRGSDEAGLF
jgi:hypothetical protein